MLKIEIYASTPHEIRLASLAIAAMAGGEPLYNLRPERGEPVGVLFDGIDEADAEEVPAPAPEVPEVPAPVAEAPAQEEEKQKRQPRRRPASARTEPAPEGSALANAGVEVAPIVEAQPEPPAEAPAPAAPVSEDDLRELVRQFNDKRGLVAVKDVLRRYNANRISEVSDANKPLFAAELRAGLK